MNLRARKTREQADPRLLGTWRSDRERTLRDWHWRPENDTPERRKKLADIFGHLQLRYTHKRIYSEFKGSKKREHANSELTEFQKKNKYTFPMAGDPKRDTYAKYATQFIPRTYLITKDGKIVYQHIGFEEGDIKELVTAIEKELK